jgi:uncharacterized protein YraI
MHRLPLHRACFWRTAALALVFVAVAAIFDQPALAQENPAAAEPVADVAPLPAPVPAIGTVSVVRLNLRVQPSMNGAVVGRLEQNDTVTIVETSADGDWYQVQTADGTEGWVFADYVATAADRSASAVSVAVGNAGSNIDGSTGAGATGAALAQVTPSRINVRGGPGTNYRVVSSANGGARLAIVGQSQDGSWYQVSVSGLAEPGWVLASLTTLYGTLNGVPKIDAPVDAQSFATTASSPPAAAGAPVVAPSTGTGFGYGITVNTWQGDKQGTANLLKQLGFDWAKQQVRWEYAESSPGDINWQEMDSIVDAMHGNGINLMFGVVTSPPWTRPTLGGTGGPPEDFQLFANFLGAIAGRYCGRLQAIEVWNEQNLRREWEGFPLEPASYMNLLKPAYNAIKGACPQTLVISGATTPAGYSDVAFDDIDYLRGMYQHGLREYSDGIGIHPSGFANPPSVRFEDWQSGSYDALSHVNHRSFYFLSTLEQSRRVMEENGDSAKKLWPTEFGWGSTPSPFPGYEYEARIGEGTQAEWIVQAFNTMRGSGYVAVPMLWNLNYPRDTEMGAFAVVGRPAFDALRRMTGR